MANLTKTGDIASRIDAYYSKKYLKKVRNNNVTSMTAVKEDIPDNNTRTIRRTKKGNFTRNTTPLTEGETPTAQTYSDSAITAVVDQYGDWSKISDVAELTIKDPVFKDMKNEMLITANDTIEELNFIELNTTTNKYGADTGNANDLQGTYSLSTITGGLTENNMQEMVKQLLGNQATVFKPTINPTNKIATVGVPKSYIVFVPASYEMELANTLDSASMGALPHQYSKPSQAMEDEIGSYYKARFIGSNLLDAMGKIGDGASNPVYPTIWLGKYAWMTVNLGNGDIESITKPFGHGEDRLDQRASTGYKFWHVAKITNDSFMARLDIEIG